MNRLEAECRPRLIAVERDIAAGRATTSLNDATATTEPAATLAAAH